MALLDSGRAGELSTARDQAAAVLLEARRVEQVKVDDAQEAEQEAVGMSPGSSYQFRAR
jgi:hypothetical protein